MAEKKGTITGERTGKIETQEDQRNERRKVGRKKMRVII